MAGVTIDLTDKTDFVTGTADADLFTAWMSKFSGSDTIRAGDGYDVLRILNGSATFGPAYFVNVTGIDELDLSNATGKIVLTVDDAMVEQSDAGVLRVRLGSARVDRLDSSGVTDPAGLILDGTGPITLIDGRDNRLSLGDAGGFVQGGTGRDRVAGGAGDDTIRGGEGGDALYGNRGRDILEGEAGDDRLEGGDGDDTLTGGAGDDVMVGGAGADRFVVGFADGHDRIEDFDAAQGDRLVLQGFTTIRSFADIATTQTATGVLLNLGGVGSVELVGRTASEVRSAVEIDGPSDAPVAAKLTGDADVLSGGSGDDIFSAYTSAIGAGDVIKAGTGIDTLKILSGVYTLDTAKLPTIVGIDVLDVTAATTPKLTIDQGFVDQSDHGVLTILHKGTPYLNTSGVGDASDVVLVGGNGVTLADGADNRVTIGDGGGKVYGGSGNDTIVGGSGSDMMVGGGGDDILVGGRGGDTMRGGAGADLFVVEAGATSLLIEDFDTNSAVERIDLDALNLSGMQDLTIRGDSGGTTVSGGGVQIRLAGVQADALAESDFVFGEDDRNPSVIRFEAGASVAEIQATIRHAAPGTVIELGAGEFRFDTTLYIDRPDIELRGAGSAQTKIVFDLDGGAEKHGIVVGDQIYAKAATSVTLKANAKAGASTVSVYDASGLKAGDFVYYSQANDQAFFDQQGYDKLTPAGTDPLREGLARIESISGSTLTLDRPLGFDLASGKATVTPIGLLEGIKIEGFQIAFTLGVADAYDFNNTKAAFESAGALKVQNTFRAEVSDIDVVQAPSNAIWFTRALELEANGLRTEGAHNKGGEGNGYGVILDEVTDSSIGNVTSLDMRHAVLFGAWNSELRNDIHVALTDRDINFHGGPDHGNTVVVDKSIADYTNKSWTIVSRGGELIHPPTDLTKNAVYFREAHAGSLNDFMRGHDDGSRLSGGGGNDTITGGSGRDVISGDLGSDLLAGGAGADRFVFTNGDGYDTILDFKASEGDVLELRNFAIDRIEDAGYRTSGSDLILDFGGSNGIVLKGLAGTSVGNLPVAIEASAEKGLSLASSPGTTMMMGSDADDTFSIYLTNVTTDTRIIGGDGDDTLFFKSGSFTFDTRNYKGFQGIETIDLTGTTTPKLYVGTQMVDAADGDQLVLRVGSQGLERLETADMPSGLKVVVEGPGRVNLGPAGAEIELSQTGRHYVVGDKGNDFVRAGDGGDRIELGAGNDTIVGGRGNDTMAGGSGADRFVFAPGGGHDVIKDWNAVDDVIFEGYGAGATFTSKLVSGGLLLSLSDDQSILLSGITSKVLSPSDVDWI